MRLRWTVVVRRGAEAVVGLLPPSVGRADLLLECPTGTPLHALPGLGLDPGRCSVSVDGEPLDLSTAVAGRGPLLDGAVLVVAGPGRPPPARRAPGPAHLLELVVLAGPDAAARHPLPRGRLLVGRSEDCDVVLRDPRLSREHCELVVGPEGVVVRDLGSTNGTRLSTAGADVAATDPGSDTGGHVGTEDGATPWRLGQELQLGASLVVLRPTGTSTVPVPTSATDEGTVLLRRAPRVRLPESAPEVRLPAAARRSRSVGFPVLAVLLPALAAGALAWWTGSAAYLLLAALGPLLVAGSWSSARREARKEGALGRRAHARETARLRARALRGAEALATARASAMPDPETWLRHAVAPGGRLWERDPTDDDAVRVRLGRAVAHGVLSIPDGGPDGGALEGPGPGPGGLVPRVVLLPGEGPARPVTTGADLLSVDLRCGPLGIVEPGDVTVARFVVGQLVAALPPGALHVCAVLGATAAPRWRWLTQLPHVLGRPDGSTRPAPSDGVSAARWVADLVRARRDPDDPREAGGAAATTVLVVVDDPDGELSTDDLSWLQEADEARVHAVVVTADATSLPRGCRTVAAPGAVDGVELTVTSVGTGLTDRCVADRVGPWWSERLARALAPLRVTTTEGPTQLPARVRLEDLLDTRPSAVVDRWAAPAPGLGVPLGLGGEGPVTVDLVTAGPHALVAGTTGSGKSELLRSWLLAIAASHPPEDVALLLVDYKGGATFDDLARLPHTVGLLTDLDGASTTRVLHSLRAEVRRRERVLAEVGARDLAELRRRSGGPGDPLPRLLVVVDEFRVLAEDAPEVLAEFVRLAATGRSLGLHLVLATQRPSGVVSADIRANAALRIVLRVQDPAESRDVVDRPDAAWLPHDRPGRAVVLGAGLDQTVQTAWSGTAGQQQVRVTVTAPRSAGAVAVGTPTDPPDRGGGASEVVEQVLTALASSGRRAAVSPWLPPLPERVDPDLLPGWTRPTGSTADAADGAGAADGAPRVDATGGRLVLGLTDLPWRQARGVLTWDPTSDGPALVLGGPGSGRSTTLTAMARSALEAGVPVVRLDVARDDADHVVDVLSALVDLPGAGDGRAVDLRVLLLVDEGDALLDPAADPVAADLVQRLLRTARGAGVGVAVAGGRSTASSRLANGARVRLVHRTADAADLVVAGLPRGARSVALPGRCLVLGLPVTPVGPETGHRGPASAEADPDAIEAQVAHAGAPTATAPPSWLPGPLPTHLPAGLLGRPTPTALGLGLVLPDVRPWRLDLDRTPLLVVAGPPGSGRSTTLATLAQQAGAAGVPVARMSDLLLGPDQTLGPDRAVEPGRSTPPGPGPSGPVRLLLVDDLERCDEQRTAALEQWLNRQDGPLTAHLAPGATVVCAGLSEWFAGEFRGVAAVARRHGCGVVLTPGRTDLRDVLGCRDPIQQRTRRAGRGLLVDRGRAVRIQVAVPG